MRSKLKLPLLLVVATLIILAMLRLGNWQLDRAAAKLVIVEQQRVKASQSPQSLSELGDSLNDANGEVDYLRFTPVRANGRYLSDSTIFVDNQVYQGQVGYKVFTAFELKNGQTVVVDRGWVSAGLSRELIPEIITPAEPVTLTGRLNYAPAKPPLWDDKYAVAQDRVWAYLPIEQYAQQFNLNPYPLVVELAPGKSSQLIIAWPEINDQWVAKHKGYAFQWFAMATAFFIACLILLYRRLRRTSTG